MANKDPILPGHPGGNPPPPPPSPAAPPPSTGTGTGTGTGSNNSGGGNPYLAAQRAANRKAANRYMHQAQGLNQQVQAIRRMLNGGYMKALDTLLANVGLETRQHMTEARQDYKVRVGALKGSAEDNEKAAADALTAGLSNKARERASALSETAAQGGGESDALRTQQMALRNWDSNQAEVNRSYYDTLRTINTGLTDLNVDTKTGMMNIQTEALSDRQGLWTDYYAAMQEAATNLGNVRGQQAELYGLAAEMGGKGAKKKRKQTEAQMGHAFDLAADNASSAWTSPGIPQRILDWKGRGAFSGYQNNSVYRQSTGTAPGIDRPEGAVLRKW